MNQEELPQMSKTELDHDDSLMPELEIFHKPKTGIFDEASYDEEGQQVKQEQGVSSTVYSTCQSNDSDGEQGTISDHSVQDDHIPIPSIEQVTIVTQKTQPQVPKPKQTVDPSCAQHVKSPRQPIRTPVTSSPIPSNNRLNWNHWKGN
ncbi:hypothetical protein Tco_0400739 [Tanacetum coccineum]